MVLDLPCPCTQCTYTGPGSANSEVGSTTSIKRSPVLMGAECCMGRAAARWPGGLRGVVTEWAPRAAHDVD